MRTCLLLALAILAACASAKSQGGHHTSPLEARAASNPPKRIPPDAIARGPMPVPTVRPPVPTYTPPGAGGPTIGQPGYVIPGVPRSKDPRILPPSPYPAIYASSPNGRKPVVRNIRPRSATNKEEWEHCEKSVAEAVTDPATFSAQMLAMAKRLTDDRWKCVHEYSLKACYFYRTAATKDRNGLLRSTLEQEDFREEMDRRIAQVCKNKDADTEAIINSIITRGHLHNWLPTSEGNVNEAFMPPEIVQMKADLRATQTRINQERKATEAKMRTISTGRVTAKAPDMSQYYMPIPVKAFNACWDVTQTCLNGLGLDAQRLPDPLYECLRWTAVQLCGFNAHSSATALNSFMDPKPQRLAKQREDMDRNWGTNWDDDAGMRLVTFGQEFLSKHCPKQWDRKWDKPFDRMRAECTGKFQTLFK